MTWQNLPCSPTLPVLFAACPHGWAEIEFTYTSGRPTADPPQDADCSLEVRRLWGIENSDEPALVDLLEDLQEPPLGMPMRDCILLARMEHRAGACNMCGRQRGPDEQGWSCFTGDWDAAPLSCPGAFPFEAVLRPAWGVDGKRPIRDPAAGRQRPRRAPRGLGRDSGPDRLHRAGADGAPRTRALRRAGLPPPAAAERHRHGGDPAGRHR